MTNYEDKGETLNSKVGIGQDNNSSSRYIFRGDDEYKGGSLGFEIGSKEAEEADIQKIWEHVSKKESYQTSRYLSFSESIRMPGNRGAIFLPKREILSRLAGMLSILLKVKVK